jgi:hypothetical protein
VPPKMMIGYTRMIHTRLCKLIGYTEITIAVSFLGNSITHAVKEHVIMVLCFPVAPTSNYHDLTVSIYCWWGILPQTLKWIPYSTVYVCVE